MDHDPGRGTYRLPPELDAIHDQARPDAVLAGIARALRPDGVFLMVDIRAESAVGDNLDHPLDTFIEEDFVNDCDVARLA